MKQKIFVFIKKYGFLLSCIIIILFYLMDSFLQLNSKDYYHYSEKMIHSQAKELKPGCVEKYEIKPIADGLEYYKINVLEDHLGGQIAFAISDENGKILKYGNYKLESQSGTIDLDVHDLNLKKNVLYFLSLNVTSVENFTVYLNSAHSLQADMVYTYEDKFLFQGILISILVVILVILIWLFWAKSIYKKFAILSMVIGLIFLFIVPPCTAPDELRHFARAYDITEGNIICGSIQTKEEFDNMTMPTCKIPSELFQLKMLSEDNVEKYDRETNNKIVFQKWKDVCSKKTGESKVEIPIHGTATISPLAYIPQITGIYIAKLFGSITGVLYYLCKFVNLLFATMIGLYALYVTPKFKEGIFVLWFIPSLVHLRSSCSTDGILFALTILVIAVFIRVREEEKIENKYFIIVVIVEILIAQIKLPYVFSSLIFLLCKKSRQVQFSRVLAFGSFFISCLSYTILSKTNSSHLNVLGNSEGVIGYIQEFVCHPIYHINMLFQSYVNDSWSYFKKAFILLDCEVIMVCFLVCIILTMKYCTDSIFDELKYRVVCILGSLFMWAGIIVIFAVESFKLSSASLWGVQGRYMLPILPFFFLGMAKNTIRGNQNIVLYNKIELAAGTILFVYALNMVNFYWL